MYIGNTPVTQLYNSALDTYNGDAATVAFTLSRIVGTEKDLDVTVNGVPQDPNTSYTVNGITLTFTEAPSAGTGNIIVRYRAYVVTKIVPDDESVTASMIANTSITGVKIATGTITGDKIGLTAITGNLIAAAAITGDKIGLTAITGNLIAVAAITGDKIAAATIGSSNLTTTGVAAGSYGGATQIPVITVGTDGRVTYSANVASGSTQPPTPYTSNGVVYAANTSALTTASGLTFDGTNLAVSGKITSNLKLSTFNTIDQQAIVVNTTWSGAPAPRLLLAVTKSGVGGGGLGIDSANDITVFDTAGTGRLTTKSTGVAVTGTLSVTTGASVGGTTAGAGGLAFPATAVAVADLNTLDDYEEGTWTPAVTGGTLTVVAATYTKIGDRVLIFFEVTFTSVPSGNITITGLPFSVAGNDIGTGALGGDKYYFASPLTFGSSFFQGNYVYFFYQNSGANGVRLTDSNIQVGTNIRTATHYRTT